ncbi:MAG: ACP S-malonyltransferase [Acidobacteriota bacterium]
MTEVWIFPGQGSQSVGMGRDLSAWYKEAHDLFETADRVLGFSLSEICFQGPRETLKQTAITQPAVLATSLAAARILKARGHEPSAVAGHSLGEYTALVVAGSLTFQDALRAVHLRGRFMQEAVPENVGAMAAILGLEPEVVDGICRDVAGDQVVTAANLNAPRQVVISGHAEAVARATEAARQVGARRIVPLDVSSPFHCPLMEPAALCLSEILAQISFRDARIPVWANVDASPVTASRDVLEALIRQVTAPVLWEKSVRRLGMTEPDSWLEVGPGSVLSGLVRQTLGKPVVRRAGDRQAIEALDAPPS